MTREEEIANAANRAFPTKDYYIPTMEILGFTFGARWADEHPQSSWINVKDDLPYKHKELLLTESRTINVFTKDEYEDFSVDFMIKINNKWYWNGDYDSDYSHWMIISKPLKE